MEMFQKLKAKLAEEMESESEREDSRGAEHDSRTPANDKERVEMLEQQVSELKEHINKNYFIYVRRLEKRKERIRELEEYSKLLLKDNEALQENQKKFEDLQSELSQSRESLEQLEGYQKTEVSKVKEMLLNTESELQKEKKSNEALRKEIKEIRSQNAVGNEQLQQTLEKRVEKSKSEYESKIALLDERLKNISLDGDEQIKALVEERRNIEVQLKTREQEMNELKMSHSSEVKDLNSKVSVLENSIKSLQSQLEAVSAERDSCKQSNLDLELSSHDNLKRLSSQLDDLKIQLAKLSSEKEALQASLERKDAEIKAKSEEHGKEMNGLHKKHEDAIHSVQAKESRLAALEAEIAVFKSKRSDEARRLTEVSGKLETLEAKYRESKAENVKKEEELRSLRESVNEAQKELEVIKNEKEELHSRFSVLNDEHDSFVIRLDEALRENETLTSQIEQLSSDKKALETKSLDLSNTIKQLESSFDQRVEQSELVQSLRNTLHVLEDELAEKKKAIRLHQQKMSDMKKTMQKELKGASSSTNSNASSEEVSFSATAVDRQGSPASDVSSSDSQVVTMTEVNFKYLKHVIFKFFTSPEYEAKHLTRAISMLLKLNPDEERLLQEHLDWKMSWFKSKPKLGSGQFSLSIDPS